MLSESSTKSEMPGQLRIDLLADFNTQKPAALLRKAAGAGALDCVEAPFGQTARLLLDASDTFWAEPYEAVLIWTQAELAVPAFQKALAFEEFSADELVREVDIFCLAPTGTEAEVRGQRRRIHGKGARISRRSGIR
jgi:hypothetical protein